MINNKQKKEFRTAPSCSLKRFKLMRASIIPIENTAVTETTTQANPNTHTKCPEAVVALSMIIA